MIGTRSINTRGTAELVRKKAPRLVLGLGLSGLAAAVEAHFRNLGWEVIRTENGDEAGRQAHRTRTTAVVLGMAPATESALLTCAKIRLTRPTARVILVGPEGQQFARHARFAGAVGYLPENAGVAAIARAVLGT